MDRPNSQTTLELCHACVFRILHNKHNSFLLGPIHKNKFFIEPTKKPPLKQALSLFPLKKNKPPVPPIMSKSISDLSQV